MNTIEEHDEKLIAAFHLMYDHFPGVAHLNHKSKEIVAANPAALAFGRKEGTFCFQRRSPEEHKGCLAEETVKNGLEQCVCRPPEDGRPGATVFWLPIEGYPDYFVHFAVLHQAHPMP